MYEVRDKGKIAYFTMIPNMVDDADLSAYAFRLYVHLKRVAGETVQCWQSQDSLEKACRMSNRTIVKAKRELINAGLIQIEVRPVNGHSGHLITINDIWNKNNECYGVY